MCLLNFTIEVMILKNIKNIFVYPYKGHNFHELFFLENKMCFIDSLKSCIILCAVRKL